MTEEEDRLGTLATSLLLTPMQLAIRWNDDTVKSPTIANVMAIQLSPDGVIITFGAAVPPLLSGTAEEQQAAVENLQEVTAIAHAKVILPFERFRELANAIQLTNSALGAAGFPAKAGESAIQQ